MRVGACIEPQYNYTAIRPFFRDTMKYILIALLLCPLIAMAIVIDPDPDGENGASTTNSQNGTLSSMISKNTTKALKTFNGVSSKKFLKNDSSFLDLNGSSDQHKFKIDSLVKSGGHPL